MFARVRARFFQSNFLPVIEAGLIGLFFIQALRFYIAELYARIASASLVASYPANLLDPTSPGFTDPALLTQNLSLAGISLALPLLGLILGRFSSSILPAVIVVAIARALVNWPDSSITQLSAAQFTIGAGLLYITHLISQRSRLLPPFILLGLAGDQLLRAAGNTLDPSTASAYYNTQIALSVIVVFIAAINTFLRIGAKDNPQEDRGLLTFWGSIGMGGLLFLQISLLSVPNAIAGRSDSDYTVLAPFVLAATLLPLLPWVRARARNFIQIFDANTRGGIWLILIALLLIIGTRVTRIPLIFGEIPLGGIALTIASFAAAMLWWWMIRLRSEREWNLSGLWIVLTILVFGICLMLDLFTYEYAFVRDFAEPLDFLNPLIPSILRGLRGMGLAVLLLATFLATLPMIQIKRRIPWNSGPALHSLIGLMLVVAAPLGISVLSRPPVVQPVVGASEIRVGTYNIHNGFNEFFEYNLEEIARAIQQSGAAVVLLQDVDAGRWTSYGADQSLWLARRLGMDRRYYSTVEGLYGLAVLSRIPIVFDDGVPLPSLDQQTGLQRVQVQDQPGTAITIYNTRLGFLLEGSSIEEQERNQRAQLEAIFRIIAEHITTDYGGQLGRTILGGTFHNVPSAPVMQRLAASGFVDPFAGASLENSATLVRLDQRARIDYLWLWSTTLISTGNGVINSTASDHRLAFVGIQIRRGD